MSNILDYVVIGGGIAGLYSNYELSKKNLNGILLEKESDFGGRSYEMKWHEHVIKLGAGIMAEHNKHLLKLLSKLKIKVNKFDSDVRTFFSYQFDMNLAIKKIKKTYKQEINNIDGLTMRQFLVKYFGKKFTDQFIENCEYRDFIESDPGYFINYYKIEDMSHDNYKVLIIRWGELVEKLVLPNCKSNSPVLNVKKAGNHFIVKTENTEYITKQIYFALTLKPLDKLIKKLVDIKYKEYIGTIPFVRIYSWHPKPYNLDMLGHYNLVPGPLQKIIKMSPNLLMASYSDNKNAKYFKTLISKNKNSQIKNVENLLEKTPLWTTCQNQKTELCESKIDKIKLGKIEDVEIGYWDEGIHYYKPIIGMSLNELIKKLSKPAKNIFVIGEIISKKQGWVEGAIESVDRVIN